MIKESKLSQILVSLVIAAAFPLLANAAEKEEVELTNHLYKQGYGNVDKSSPEDNSNFDEEYEKFKSRATFSKTNAYTYSGSRGSSVRSTTTRAATRTVRASGGCSRR